MPPQLSCWEIYNRQMSQLNHGYALWEPAPLHYFERVRPGDVGYVRRGCFNLLFSAGSPLGERELGIDVPATFKQLDVGPILKTQPRLPSCLSTSAVREIPHPRGSMYTNMEPGSGVSFQLTGDQGAALLTKHPTYKEDVQLERTFGEYTIKHYDSWVAFARERGHPDDIKPVLVTGVDMTRDFAVMSYWNNGGGLTAEFAISAPGVDSPWGRWRTPGVVYTNCGPQVCSPPSIAHTVDLGSSGSNSHPETVSGEYHQCVFLRYYTVRKRLGIPRVMKAAAGPHDLGPGSRNNGRSPIGAQHNSDSGSDTLSSPSDTDGDGGGRCSDTSIDSESDILVHNTTADEGDDFDTVADYIFRNSNVDSALIHHQDIALLREPGSTIAISIQLLERQPPITVDSNGVGMIERQTQLPANTWPNDPLVTPTRSPPDASNINHHNKALSGPDSTGSPRSAAIRISEGFEVEKSSPLSPRHRLPSVKRPASVDPTGVALQTYLLPLLAAKARPFTVSGLIPLDPANLVVFFRSESGIAHSLDFPIDIDYDLPPTLDVLMAACSPHASDLDEYTSARESLFYPPNLPLSATIEIANHPIIDAVRNTLFPTLPKGHHLTAVRNMLEIVPKGGRMTSPPKPMDNRVATIITTLPVRYRGGALIIRDPSPLGDSNEETYRGGGKSHSSAQGRTDVGIDNLEWIAFLANCDYEVEEVSKGLRLTISYAVYVRSFGAGGIMLDPLITPSDKFLDLVAPILNICRGRKIAFYLTEEYEVNPAEMLAESLVPHLKGADVLLHHALKLYKLAPELQWTAGGYIWPVDRVVECPDDLSSTGTPPSAPNPRDGSYRSPAMMRANMLRSPMTNLSVGSLISSLPPITIPIPMTDPTEEDSLRRNVENSSARPLTEEDIMLMVTPDPAGGPPHLGPVSKEKVPFVSGGQLDKFIVNVLMVAFVP